MNIKDIQISNYQWSSNEAIECIVEESLEGRLYSWGEFSIPTKYTKCDGNNLAMRKCTVTSQLFIECEFNYIDASDSIFIDCLFLDCSFKNANFNNATFIGTAIIQDGYLPNNEIFNGAGMSQTKFKSSNFNHSVLSNLNLEGCGFRHSIFEDVIFNEVSIKHTSFENAYFKNCVIDNFDLRNSACRGIIIDDCKIKKYISSLEKVLGGIGALQVLEYCDSFELYVGEYKIDELSILWEKLKEISNKSILEGQLFEFINIMNYLYTKEQEEISKKYNLSQKHAIQLSIHNNSLNGYPVLEEGDFLYKVINWAYEKVNDNGKKINLDDILYTLKLMFFLNINEYILLSSMLAIYKNEALTHQNDYSDFLVLSQIKHYFQAIGDRIKSNMYRITFHNETASWLNKDDRNNFYEFCNQFVAIAVEGDRDFKLVSMHEGSIDAIFESLFSIENILIAASILGCRFEIKGGEINFSISPAEGIKSYGEFITLIIPIIPLLKNKKITENKFEDIFRKAKNSLKNLVKYARRNKINGNIKQNDASKEIEETIRETRKIEKQGTKSTTCETIVTKRKITQKRLSKK